MRLLSAVSEALRSQYGGARAGEPVAEAGRLPLLGCAIDYGRHAADFLGGLRAKHGDVFTVFLAGKRMTFLCDPLDYPALLLHKELDFHELANQISSRAFGHTLESVDLIDNEAIIRLSIERMRGDDLALMSQRMQSKLEAALLDTPHLPAAGLFDFTAQTIFHAASDAIFGDGFDHPSLYQAFRRFDTRFPLLIAGLPPVLLRGIAAARRLLASRFDQEHANACTLVLERERMFAGKVDGQNRAAMQLALLWAANANTIPATFWTLFHIARDEAASAAVTDEIRGVMDTADRDPASGRVCFDRAALERMVHLDSAIHEALRLTSGSLVIRVARRATSLELHDGRTLCVRAGDRVAIYPYLTHHDPELFAEPERYVHDRFLEGGRPRRHFERRGERVRHFLMPFGGGVSMCPGRHFAANEIKLYTAILLHHFDLVLERTDVPALDQTRAGLGILPPVRDVPFTLCRRAERPVARARDAAI